jgi:hypothetical protein
MATTVISTSTPVGLLREARATRFQRYVLRRAHPASLFVEMVGFVWFVFYLWNHLLMEAILVVILARVVASVLVFRADTDAIAKTVMGKIALLHLRPINMLTQILGVAIAVYGIWMHDTRVILVGVSAVLLGHLVGWSRVDPRFELH